jgi:hypothetical protein
MNEEKNSIGLREKPKIQKIYSSGRFPADSIFWYLL